MGSVKKQIDAILNKEMDRGEFLQHIAIGFAMFLGLGAVLRLLAFHGSEADSQLSNYGGDRDAK